MGMEGGDVGMMWRGDGGKMWWEWWLRMIYMYDFDVFVG